MAAITDDDDGFNFWAEKHQHPTKNYDNYYYYGDREVDEFQPRNRIEDEYDGLSCLPPPKSWRTRGASSSNSIGCGKAFPLLLSHNRSSPLRSRSRARRLEVILAARKKLMEMVENMPEEESLYELSLKDIVQQTAAIEEEEGVIIVKDQKLFVVEVEETKINGEVEISKKKKLKSSRRKGGGGRICRSESMDSGVFLLNMFVPSSLMRKKKKKKSSSRDCSKPLEEESRKLSRNNKDRWWNITSIWKNKNMHMNNGSNSKSTGSRHTSSSRRKAESNLFSSNRRSSSPEKNNNRPRCHNRGRWCFSFS